MTELMPTSVDQYATINKARFAEQLAKFGPNRQDQSSSSGRALDLRSAEEYCRELAHSHYENFSVASWLVPKSLRQDFCNVYCYCRWADDLSDEIDGSENSKILLAWWRELTTQMFSDDTERKSDGSSWASHPVLIALHQTVCKHDLDIGDFLNLINAFEQDQEKTRYSSHAEVLDYCQGSANPVGRIVLKMADHFSPANAEASDQICEGLQIANFAQDVKRDGELGRIYMPYEHFVEFGVEEFELIEGNSSPKTRKAVLEWCDYAEQRLLKGSSLIDSVDGWLRRNIYIFAGGGLAIIEAIRKNRGDVWEKRISVSRWSKAKLLASAAWRPSARKLIRETSNRQSTGPR